jgi:hypothetical protein
MSAFSTKPYLSGVFSLFAGCYLTVRCGCFGLRQLFSHVQDTRETNHETQAPPQSPAVAGGGAAAACGGQGDECGGQFRGGYREASNGPLATWLRWLRWAAWASLLALLVGAISSEMMDVGECQVLGNNFGVVSERVAERENLPAKSSYMLRRIGEDIEVSGPTPKIEEFPTGLHVQYILRRDGWAGVSWGQPTAGLGIRRDEGVTNLCGWIIEIEVGRQRGYAQYAFAMHGHVFGRGVSAIFPVRPESPIVEIGSRIDFPEWGYSGSENEGPLSGDHCIPGYIGGLLGGGDGRFHVASLRSTGAPSNNPEADSRNTQDEGKKGHGVGRRPLPDGFALFCLKAAVASGLLTLAFFAVCRRV